MTRSLGVGAVDSDSGAGSSRPSDRGSADGSRGAEGRAITGRLEQELGRRYLDTQIIEAAAEKAGVSLGLVVQAESRRGLIARIMEGIAVSGAGTFGEPSLNAWLLERLLAPQSGFVGVTGIADDHLAVALIATGHTAELGWQLGEIHRPCHKRPGVDCAAAEGGERLFELPAGIAHDELERQLLVDPNDGHEAILVHADAHDDDPATRFHRVHSLANDPRNADAIEDDVRPLLGCSRAEALRERRRKVSGQGIQDQVGSQLSRQLAPRRHGIADGEIRDHILTESNIRDLVRMLDEEMDGVAREQRQQLETIEQELEDGRQRLSRVWQVVENTDLEMADASDRIKEHRERQQRLVASIPALRSPAEATIARLEGTSLASQIPRNTEDFAATCEQLRERVVTEVEAGHLNKVAEAMQLAVEIQRTEDGASGLLKA